MTEVAFDTSMVAPGEGEFLDTGTFDGNDQTGPQSADPSADVEVEEEFDFELGGASDAENFGHVDVDGGMQNEVALSVPESARDMRAESEIGYEDDANDEAPLSNPDVAETADLEAQDVDEIDYVDSTAGFNNTEVDDVAQETASVEPDQAGEKVEDDPDDETSGFNMDADAAGQSQDIHDGQAEAHTPEAQGSGNSPHHASPSENDLGAKAGGPRDAAGEPASFVAPGPEVYVIYNDATYELCARPGNEDPDTFFFAGEEELDYSLYRFLGCLRGVIADDLASGDKVHLRIDQLDLEIGETSSQSFLDHTTFREIIDLFRKLLQNDGITETADCPRLDVQLFVRQDCEQRFSDLLDAANAGTGLSELVDDHNYSDFSDGSSPTGPGDAGEEQRDGGMAGAEALESHGDEPRQDVSHDGDDVTDTQQNAAADALEVDLGAYEENYGDEEASIPTAGDSNLTNNQNAAQPDRDEQGSADDEAEYAAEDNVYLGKDDDEIGYDEFDGPVDAQADQNTNPGNNAPEDGHLSGEVNYPQTEAFAPTTAPEGAEDGEQQEDNGVDHVDGQEIVDEGHPVSAEQDEDNQDGYAAEDVDDVVGFDGDGDDAEEVEEAEDQRTTGNDSPSPASQTRTPLARKRKFDAVDWLDFDIPDPQLEGSLPPAPKHPRLSCTSPCPFLHLHLAHKPLCARHGLSADAHDDESRGSEPRTHTFPLHSATPSRQDEISVPATGRDDDLIDYSDDEDYTFLPGHLGGKDAVPLPPFVPGPMIGLNGGGDSTCIEYDEDEHSAPLVNVVAPPPRTVVSKAPSSTLAPLSRPVAFGSAKTASGTREVLARAGPLAPISGLGTVPPSMEEPQFLRAALSADLRHLPLSRAQQITTCHHSHNDLVSYSPTVSSLTARANEDLLQDHVEHPSPAQASPAPDASQVSVREAGDEDNYVEFEGGELDDQPVAPEHDSARKETGATQLSLPESLSKVTESGPSSATSTLKGDEISYEEDAEEVDDDFDVDIHAADGEENSAAADEIDWENDGYDDAGHPAVEEEEGEIVEQGGDDLSSVSIKRRRQVDDASDLAGESADAKRRRT